MHPFSGRYPLVLHPSPELKVRILLNPILLKLSILFLKPKLLLAFLFGSIGGKPCILQLFLADKSPIKLTLFLFKSIGSSLLAVSDVKAGHYGLVTKPIVLQLFLADKAPTVLTLFLSKFISGYFLPGGDGFSKPFTLTGLSLFKLFLFEPYIPGLTILFSRFFELIPLLLGGEVLFQSLHFGSIVPLIPSETCEVIGPSYVPTSLSCEGRSPKGLTIFHALTFCCVSISGSLNPCSLLTLGSYPYEIGIESLA